MPSINMIAARRAEKRRIQQNTRKLIYAIVGEVGLVLVAVSFMVGRLVTTCGTIDRLDMRIKALEPKVNEIQQLQSDTASLQPKVQVLQDASASTNYWYSALSTISSGLHGAAWVTSVAATGNPDAAPPKDSSGPAADGAKLNLQGMAANQIAVGNAMLRLNTYPAVNQVSLNVLEQTVIGAKPAVNFQMVVQLKPHDKAAEKLGGNGNVQKS